MARSNVLVSIVVVVVGGQVAVGQTPFVDSLLSHEPYFDLPAPYDWTDVPDSVKTVTIPAGTAVLVYSMTANSPGVDMNTARVRPVIGGSFPAGAALFGPYRDSRALAAGSWSTVTEGGTVDVKLQVKQSAPYDLEMRPSHAVAWTLTVHPDVSPVPAISGVGLAVMVAFLVAVGGFIFSRRRQQTA